MQDYYSIVCQENYSDTLSQEKGILCHALIEELNTVTDHNIDIEIIKFKYPYISQGILLFKLYTSEQWQGYKSFGDFTKDILNITFSKAKKLITCSRIALLLLESGISEIPTSLSAYDKLSFLEDDNLDLSKERIVELYKEALELNDQKKPSINMILDAIDNLYPECLPKKEKEKLELAKQDIENQEDLEKEDTEIKELTETTIDKLKSLSAIARQCNISLSELLDKMLHSKYLTRLKDSLIKSQSTANKQQNEEINQLEQLQLQLC